MLIIGDLHIKNKEPFLSAIKNFFEWLDEKYPDEEIIFLGDTFDTSSPSWEIFSLFAEFVRSRNSYVYILEGNHTYSKLKGSVLEGLGNVSNVKHYLIPDTIGLNILCLPFLTINNKKYYEKQFEFIPNDFNLILTHLTPKQCAFGNEGIDFDKLNLKGTYIHGHVHMQSEFRDSYGNRHIVLGVPIPTRNLEEQQNHRIIRIINNEIEFIPVPQFFTYETLEFGKFPENKNNILNLKNVPSWEELYKTYKNYYIREDGVEFKKTENSLTFNNTEFEKGSLKEKFNLYLLSDGVGLDKKIIDECFSRIDKYENIIGE